MSGNFASLLAWGRSFVERYGRETFRTVRPYIRVGERAVCDCGAAVLRFSGNAAGAEYDRQSARIMGVYRAESQLVGERWDTFNTMLEQKRRNLREANDRAYREGCIGRDHHNEMVRALEAEISEAFGIAYDARWAVSRELNDASEKALESLVVARDCALASKACENCDECSECCKCPTCDNCGDHANSVCEGCNRCDDCCSCLTCAGCESRVADDDACGECRRCESCCSCETCDNCGDRVQSRCSEGDCGRCCDCDEDEPEAGENVKFFKMPLKFHEANRTRRKRNLSGRCVSVEIEVAKVDRGNTVSKAVKKWSGSIVRDGSLPQGGFEINTAPASGDLFVDQIEEICGALKNGNAEVTEACGLHVHVDARKFDFYDIQRLVKIYAKIEPALFEMVPKSREESDFCHPCGENYTKALAAKDAPDTRLNPKQRSSSCGSSARRGSCGLWNCSQCGPSEQQAPQPAAKLPGKQSEKRKRALLERMKRRAVKAKIHGVVYPTAKGTSIKESKKHKYHHTRYNALNLHSQFYRGTVECRIFNGTTNPGKIIAWGMLWARILDYAWEKSEAEIARELTGSPRECLKTIAADLPRVLAFIGTRWGQYGDRRNRRSRSAA